MNLSERTYLWHVVLMRLWIGYYMLYQGIRKYSRDFPHTDWIGTQIGDLNKIEIYPWYKSFLMDVVVPNKELFSHLVMWGEILVGACLILGLLTRWTSVVGLFMLVNYFFGPGMARGGAPMAQQQTFIVAFVMFILSNPGRTLGLDGLVFRREPVKPQRRVSPAGTR
ncbi:MAG TPA: DoxX family protein [Candidatus Binatia bacterium]|jgi:thiosulfate dehydrogenase [quinone] large subunit